MPAHLPSRPLTRRDFLKLTAASLGALALRPLGRLFTLGDFPQAERLGRICVGSAELKARPDQNAQTLSMVYEDTVFPWLREVAGPRPWRNNQRWVETPDGYIWSAFLQPVRNHPQTPVEALPQMGEETGMWVEVSVPYVDAVIDNPPVRSAWWRHREASGLPFRFYYSQILWIDRLKTENGAVWYRVNERYGNPGDAFWCPAEAFRVITREEVAPITPEITDKHIEVNVGWGVQTLSCYEGNTEVYFCRVSSGQDDGSTPLTPYPSPGFQIWRKLFSIHMGGNTASGSWDVPAVGWTSLFVGDGVSIHSTYWHNNFGEPMSHGCVNVSPDDAKWIFRWTHPEVPFETGDLTIVGEGGTRVIVRDW